MAWASRTRLPRQADVAARLAPPPRRVPLTLAARALLGGAAFAWIWLAFGSSIATAFLLKTDLGSWLAFRGERVAVPAVVTGCAATGASEGGGKGRSGTPIYANRYAFDAGGGEREGVSYALGECLEAGAEVQVEFPAGRPERSRIVGMRRAWFGPEVAFVLVFPLAGLLLLFFSLRKGWRELRLLRRGKLALGTLVGKEATNVSVNKQRVMKLRFALETERGRQEVLVKTHLTGAVEDEPRERILYDPERPERAAAWDLLSGHPRVDFAGGLEPAGLRGLLLAIAPPLLAVAGHVLAVMLARG